VRIEIAREGVLRRMRGPAFAVHVPVAKQPRELERMRQDVRVAGALHEAGAGLVEVLNLWGELLAHVTSSELGLAAGRVSG